MERLGVTGYLVASEHRARALESLSGVVEVHEPPTLSRDSSEERGRRGRRSRDSACGESTLLLAQGPEQRCVWAHNVWREVQRTSFASITSAAQQLAALQRNWWPYAPRLHRRTALIAAALPHVSARPLEFPCPAPIAPLGSFMLLNEHELVCSAACSSPFPNGEPRFVQYTEHQGPPSRAYLKLFEALTLLGTHPQLGQHCLELGASPGGWTWVLAKLGSRVTAVDRAPLAPTVASLTQVTSLTTSAFGLGPEQLGAVDWLFSDVVCYPEKLFRYLERWLSSGRCERFVCTLKFQGHDQYHIIDRVLTQLGGRLVHLAHNRHELTWLRLPE